MNTQIPSVEDIKTGFPFQRFTEIQGEPTYATLNKMEQQAIRNATATEIMLPLPHNNLAGIVEQPQVYLIRTGAPFPRPHYPGNAPTFQPGSIVAQRQTIQQQYYTDLRNFHIT